MQYKLLGGLRVSELALGTMTFGTAWGWGADEATSRQIFDVYAAAGGNFLDTANNYTNGQSEEIVGDLIAADRDHFVVATKYTLVNPALGNDDPNFGGNGRKNMRRSVENSLRRLNTDYIDVLYLHMWDFTTPLHEVLRGMDDLVRQGKVLHVAFSDTPAWVISRAVTLAEQHGWVRPIATQLPYSLLDRSPERALIPMANALDLGVVAWSVLESGALTGKFNRDEEPDAQRRSGIDEATRAKVAQVIAVADEIGVSPAQVAINWVRQRNALTIPLVGARKVEQMQDNIGALDFTLTEAQIATLDAVAGLKLGFPLSFLTSDHVRGLIFGETFEKIDNHRSPV